MAENKDKKFRKEIWTTAIIAIIIVVIVGLFINQSYNESKNQEKMQQEINDYTNKSMDDKAKEADEIRKAQEDSSGIDSSKYEGTYAVAGNSNGFTALSLLPGSEAMASSIDSMDAKKGTWLAKEKDGIVVLSIAFPGDDALDIYNFQVWNDYLIDIESIYFGEIPHGNTGDTVFTKIAPEGKMVMNLSRDGKVSGEFLSTDKESEDNGATYAYSGSYKTEGNIMSITLNGDTTDFIMFDLDSPKLKNDSGIASVYFKKQA